MRCDRRAAESQLTETQQRVTAVEDDLREVSGRQAAAQTAVGRLHMERQQLTETNSKLTARVQKLRRCVATIRDNY